MSGSNHDLREYYEEEARQRLRTGPLKGMRIEVRQSFIDLLAKEHRDSVVDFGAGPGRDGEAFVAAGHNFLGLDLAHGNGVLAATQGLHVVQGSMTEPPIQPGSFDAGWSMSTLMHLPEHEAAGAVQAMSHTLQTGAPFLIGLWGGELGDVVDSEAIEGQRRLFSLRSAERNGAILSSAGTIEHQQVWEIGADGWNYQTFRLRV